MGLKHLVKSVWVYFVGVIVLATLLAMTMHFSAFLNDYTAGTLQGLFIALISLLIYLTYQEAAARREKLIAIKTIKSALHSELDKIKKNLDGAVRLKKREEEKQRAYVPHVDLFFDVMRSVVNSGKFTLLDLETQLELSHGYVVVERAQDYLLRMRNLRTSPAFGHAMDESFAGLSQNFWGQVEHLRKKIPGVMEKLQGTD